MSIPDSVSGGDTGGSDGNGNGNGGELEPPPPGVAAGEFVLGVLNAQERRAAQARTESDPVFAREVLDWERRLAPLLADVEPVPPPAHVWPLIRTRLEWQRGPSRPGLWHNLGVWRLTAGLATAIAIAAIVIGRVPWWTPVPVEFPATERTLPVTALAHDDGTPGWLASIDATRGTVSLVPVPAAPDSEGRVAELWLIPPGPGQAPRPLGLLPPDRSYTVAVPLDLRKSLATGAVLAVSLEPPGGAPGGSPTGPIIAKGIVRI